MPLYLAELYRASAKSGDLASMTRTGTRVRYVRLVFVPADETWFLLYEAPSAAESVWEATRRAGISVERVVEAVEIAPARATRPARRPPGARGGDR